MEKTSEKLEMVGDNVYYLYTIKHCIQGPYQGPLHILQKGNLSWCDKKVKKNNMQMVLPIRVHVMGCSEGGHINGKKNQSSSPAL